MEINLKKFIEIINMCEKEILCTTNEEGYISSHNIEGTICIIEEGEEDDTFYAIKEIEIDRLLGCQCGAGITIKVEKEKD